MMQNKKVIGITGGSGSGKSHIRALLKKAGYDAVDADEIAHNCLEKEDCKNEVLVEFGEGILENGKINRKKLGEIVFKNSEKLEKLGKITHKYILSDIADEIGKARGNTVFVDGAVLIESGMKCDFMIGIIADKKVRKARIMARDNLTESAADQRISAQKEEGFYSKNCDMVIENSSGEPDIAAIIKRIEL
ncbi:MAG: dephospho-CoA kinase [Clostridia bacterium]|nr:dephospho-CoA kinase [Clostridia bacterium]